MKVQPRFRRQRWNASAPLRFRRRMKIGDTVVLPGDPVTADMRNLVGRKLPAWFLGGFVELDIDAWEAMRRPAPAPAAPVALAAPAAIPVSKYAGVSLSRAEIPEQ